jgi:hypothetical protein
MNTGTAPSHATERSHMPNIKLTAKERLLRHIRIDTITNCWIWTGCIYRGYGRVGDDNGRNVMAHRLSYETFKGPIPTGMEPDHICHNPSICDGGDSCLHRRCINPDHLEAVTHQENVRRGCIGQFNRLRGSSITHCPQGHEYTPANTRTYNGCRSCLSCSRERARRSRSQVQPPVAAVAGQTQ